MYKNRIITWGQWLNWACLMLKASSSPKIDAEILLKKVVKKSRSQLLAFEDTVLQRIQIIQLNSLIRRRQQGEPVAYLTGEKEFWSLNFRVSKGVFIPRSDTERLIELILDLFPVFSCIKVLDLGTGVGTIALSIASERPYWNILGIDREKIALILAHKNQSLFKFKNVQFFYGNWFAHLKGQKFDLIVSNPPYIKSDDTCWLINDMNFEPKSALLSKNSGLKDLTKILKNSIHHLYPNGWLFLEHGWNQGYYIRSLFAKYKFCHIQTIFDYNNQERITYGQWV